MYTHVFFQEAETGTASAKEITRILKSSGYKKIGHGADATVWIKGDSAYILKILMPEYQNIEQAAEIFKNFVNFCIENQDLPSVPKFLPVDGEYYSFFEIKGKTYVQVFMERLYPIPKGSYDEGMVWFLEDFAKEPDSWDQILAKLSTPQIWLPFWKKKDAIFFAETTKNLSKQQKLKFHLLFATMQVLHRTGKINQYGWDLHTANIMKRDNGDLVIIDPWFMKNA